MSDDLRKALDRATEASFRLFDDVDWTMDEQECAQLFGWELNQFEDGQLVIVADEDRDTFTGPSRNLKAHNHVARTASGRLTDGYRKLCWKAREIVGLSALSQQGDKR